MKKLFLVIAILGISACSNKGVPAIDNLCEATSKMRDVNFIRTEGVDSIRLHADGKDFTFKEFYDNYCLGNDATDKNCLAVDQLISKQKRLGSLTKKSNLGYLSNK